MFSDHCNPLQQEHTHTFTYMNTHAHTMAAVDTLLTTLQSTGSGKQHMNDVRDIVFTS